MTKWRVFRNGRTGTIIVVDNLTKDEAEDMVKSMNAFSSSNGGMFRYFLGSYEEARQDYLGKKPHIYKEGQGMYACEGMGRTGVGFTPMEAWQQWMNSK